jgi:hypothetical protein
MSRGSMVWVTRFKCLELDTLRVKSIEFGSKLRFVGQGFEEIGS